MGDNPRYADGSSVIIGDVVEVNGIRGRVSNIFNPDTSEAEWFGCKNTGGILIDFENSDRQLWREADEDLIRVTT